MQEVYRSMARLMATALTVLITGESGTGKELVARALHNYGNRKVGPFVPINIAAIPRELIEGELFGYEREAFTGALKRNIGRFEQADGGTLFIDEIGDATLDIQEKLLRAIENGEIAGCGLDVFETEPLPEDHKLWKLNNVLMTPHVAVADADNLPDRRFQVLLENARRFLKDEKLENVVDKSKWY